MNRVLRTAYAVAAGVLLLTACAKEVDPSYNESEQLALREWMAINRPELVDNYQTDGGYYVDVLDQGSTDTRPISDTATWVRFTFEGRNLAGDLVLTRDEVQAYQMGTYTKFTRYVPYYKYFGGTANGGLIEGTYLAIRNKLNLGEKYAADRNYPREIEMRYGTKVTLYMPSTVVGAGGVSGSGGYEGQYQLKSGAPFVVTMQITDTVRNPLQREGKVVDDFGDNNGGRKLPPKPTTSLPIQRVAGNDGDILPPPIIFDTWVYANKDVPQVYMNLKFVPTTKFKYPSIYASRFAPYNDFNKLEQDICDTLVNRFGEYAGYDALPAADTVSLDGTAKIWYIGRFLDGFIFDSNIPGVRRLIYGENKTSGTPLSYTPASNKLIQAFYYTVRQFRYGQWACILTTSTSAYGASGTGGDTNTSSSSNGADYLNYYNYMNSYYGGGGYYNGYYGNYYDNYMYGAYSDYSNSTVTSSTTTSVSTEIPPFTPLLFELYIEPKSK